MEPSNLYNHSKRNLVIFAAILALVLFGGVEATEVSKAFGFKIQAKVLPTVLFFVVGYLLYQFFLARVFQTDDVRTRTTLDFAITTIFASIVLSGYLVFYLLHQILGLGTPAFLFGIPVLISALAAGFVLTQGAEWMKWRRETISLREVTIERRLKEPGWILNFNPKSPRGTKPISFEDGGSIGEGKNVNEYSWHLDGNKLEILNEHGERQNMFDYDPATDEFKSTGRARKANIEGQYIYRTNE